jgi:hypothetical protein
MTETPGSVADAHAENAAVSLHYYFQHTFFFRFVVGKCSRPQSRFLLILICFILTVAVFCQIDGLVFTKGDVVGIADDPLFFSLCVILPFGFWAVLNLIKKLDDLLSAIPHFTTEADTIVGQSSLEKLISSDTKEIREFVSLRTRFAWRIYFGLFVSIAMLFLFTQIHFTGLSWALDPGHLRTYSVACLWTLFWNAAAAEIFWFVFSITIITFSRIQRYAKAETIIISPVYTDQVAALSKVGDFAVANALFFTCGLFVLIPWVWKFSPTKIGYAYIFAYAIGMIAIGILPVWKIRSAIKKAKMVQLKKLGTLFNEYLKLLIADVKQMQGTAGRATDVPSTVDVGRIALLEVAYARVEKMPTWPFTGRVRAIFSANMAAVFVTPLAKNYVSEWFGFFFSH